MWDLTVIKEKAINEVFYRDAITPRAKISLARDYGLSKELLYSLGLFTRRRLIEAGDMNDLSLDYFLKILEVQERVDPVRSITECNQCQSVSLTKIPIRGLRRKYDFTKSLQFIFVDEIERLRKGPEEVSKTAGPVDPERDEKCNIGVFFLAS
jgi:hypothetical protein